MKRTLAIAAAAILLTATAAFAQASSTAAPPAGNSMMMKGKAPSSDAAKTQAPADAAASANADTGAVKPRAHHRMAKSEAALNASEAETTKQLNEQQAQMAKAPQ